MRKLFLIVALMCLFLPIQAQNAPNNEQAWAFLALINAQRAEAGIREVALNPQLNVAAQRHSDDMAAGEFLSHTGSDGSEFWQRIADTGYNMTSGAENVLYRSDVSAAGAFTQWQGSTGHNANMMNPVYQEIGLGVTTSVSGRVYYTLVLAARSDFSPPTATPMPTQTATITPTLTMIPPTFAPTFTPLPAQPTIVPTRTPIPLPITPTTTTIPPTQIVAEPTIAQAQSQSPDWLQGASQQGIASALIGQVRIDQIPPTQVVLPTLPATPTPQPRFDIRLEYSAQSFTLINIAETALFIDGLYFEGDSGVLDINRWENEFLSAPLSNFPSSGCLQVWDLDAGGVLDAPASCGVRHAWIAVNDNADFWQSSTTFTVYRYGEVVTTCAVNTGVCEFDLDERLSQPTPNTVDTPNTNPVTVGASDVLLVYDDESFSLVNTSGVDLNLTGIGFASANGAVSISQWNTEFLSRPLETFPTGDCLQAWSIFAEEWSPRPDECNTRHAWIAVNDAQLFWMNTDAFTVNRGGAVLATCNVSVGRCEVNLP